MRASRFVLILAIASAVLAGCGVRFHDPEPGNEFFKSATVSGLLLTGSTLTGAITIAQRYNIEVPFTCELRQGKQLIKPIGNDIVSALEGGTPKSAPLQADYAFPFTVDAPGAYKFECFTAKDEDNFIIREFSVR